MTVVFAKRESLSHRGSTVSGGPPSQLMSTFIDEMLQDGSVTKHIREVLIPAGGVAFQPSNLGRILMFVCA